MNCAGACSLAADLGHGRHPEARRRREPRWARPSGLCRRRPDFDVVRVQDIGLRGTDDREILAWAAREERVLLSHDVRTMTVFAVARIHAGERLAGLVILPQSDAVGRTIDALIQLVDEHSESGLQGQIVYLSL